MIDLDTKSHELAYNLKQCSKSFFYTLSPEALVTCRKVAALSLMGEIPPAETKLTLEEIEAVRVSTDPYMQSGVKNLGIRRFYDIVRFFAQFFIFLGRRADPAQEMYELFRKDIKDKSPFFTLPPEIVGRIAGDGAEFHGFSALQKYCEGYEHLFWEGMVARIGWSNNPS